MECPDFLTALAQVAVQRPTLNLWTPGTNLLISARWIDDSGKVRNSSNYMSFLLHGRSKSPSMSLVKCLTPPPSSKTIRCLDARQCVCTHESATARRTCAAHDHFTVRLALNTELHEHARLARHRTQCKEGEFGYLLGRLGEWHLRQPYRGNQLLPS